MNERFENLAEQAMVHVPSAKGLHTRTFSLEKFAELIVRECAMLCDQAVEENKRTFYTVTETQEVGPALVAKGAQVQAEKLSRQIKQHFGAEE